MVEFLNNFRKSNFNNPTNIKSVPKCILEIFQYLI